MTTMCNLIVKKHEWTLWKDNNDDNYWRKIGPYLKMIFFMVSQTKDKITWIIFNHCLFQYLLGE